MTLKEKIEALRLNSPDESILIGSKKIPTLSFENSMNQAIIAGCTTAACTTAACNEVEWWITQDSLHWKGGRSFSLKKIKGFCNVDGRVVAVTDGNKGIPLLDTTYASPDKIAEVLTLISRIILENTEIVKHCSNQELWIQTLVEIQKENFASESLNLKIGNRMVNHARLLQVINRRYDCYYSESDIIAMYDDSIFLGGSQGILFFVDGLASYRRKSLFLIKYLDTRTHPIIEPNRPNSISWEGITISFFNPLEAQLVFKLITAQLSYLFEERRIEPWEKVLIKL